MIEIEVVVGYINNAIFSFPPLPFFVAILSRREDDNSFHGYSTRDPRNKTSHLEESLVEMIIGKRRPNDDNDLNILFFFLPATL